MMMSKSEYQGPSKTMVAALLSYAFFGVLHEAFHFVAAALTFSSWCDKETPSLENVLPNLSTFLMEALLGRMVRIPNLGNDSNCFLNHDFQEQRIGIIQHAGWALSLLTAMGVVYLSHHSKSRSAISSACRTAAVVTALEAIGTDLLGWVTRTTTTSNSLIFFCGNFGIILLHPAWNESNSVFDLLNRMIQITMMRGAQSGGVVMWESKTSKDKNGTTTTINKENCVRVIKAKRQDLSKLLTGRVRAKGCTWRGDKNPSIRTFLGHTRFATSSKATLEGTHPHQWTPPEKRRVYPLDDDALWNTTDATKMQPTTRKMSNYITHNGDFDFFKMHGRLASLSKIQKWLAAATGHPIPAQVDSACIAGMIDILRTAGCWGLSLRFAMLLGVPGVTYLDPDSEQLASPRYDGFADMGLHFEKALAKFCAQQKVSLAQIRDSPSLKHELSSIINDEFHHQTTLQTLNLDSGDLEAQHFSLIVHATVEAFFVNDLFFSTTYFMQHAIGSFGIMVTCSEDANRQICLAARGQPMSVAFYPKKGLVLYGSELAAVKAGMSFEMPGGDLDMPPPTQVTDDNVSMTSTRLNLDDLGGEVMLLDWSNMATIRNNARGPSSSESQIPMVSVKVHRESGIDRHKLHLRDRGRLTMLEGNDLLRPLPTDDGDIVQRDLYEIPDALERIQTEWKENSTNRHTAVSLSSCIKERLLGRMDGSIPLTPGTVDVLVTGCEVSLWLAEQFASDLQKALPKLSVRAMSSNKILGIFGQELAVPASGFPFSTTATDFHDSIVLLVSQSGGTFGPSAISNLLQSVTQNLFLVTSEWDTQMGKRLLDLDSEDLRRGKYLSRIFTTNIGLRTAEPCTLSVAATHQLLTQIFQYICASILEKTELRKAAGAIISEKDLAILTSCNEASIDDLRSIIGDRDTTKSQTERNLRRCGNMWANHVLENAKALILSFIYVVVTVTTGFPVATAVHHVAKGDDDALLYFARFLDSLIYFFIPQICIIFIRLVEGRDLRHRMVGRTIVVADIPWVAQSVEAFVSKIFACSYSMAGVNVISGNPQDHLVHKHTHRVVRGTLLACGRPDGRLSALTSAESAVNLSVSQACSIVSMGGNCEAVTIGHNPTNLGLSKVDIFLPTTRARFLGEYIKEKGLKTRQRALLNRQNFNDKVQFGRGGGRLQRRSLFFKFIETDNLWSDTNSIKAFYLGVHEKGRARARARSSIISVPDALQHMEWSNLNTNSMDLSTEIWSGNVNNLDPSLATFTTPDNILLPEPKLQPQQHPDHSMEPTIYRDEKGLLQVRCTLDDYFGQDSQFTVPNASGAFDLIEEQNFVMELYESRIASLERFVAFCVMFHQMGKRVQEFFPRVSFGLLGYRMDRTHSILRVATTASPISGDAVQERMKVLRLQVRDRKAAHKIQVAWKRHRNACIQKLLNSAKTQRTDSGSTDQSLK
uniref:Glutamine amidotransferase type-2 domain-containing protein n=1 Tax=Entomoneis paludosa TaxID=265537 RepID=A0A7S3DUG1_9STRA|mmetsp:Transcript_38091/g.79201  ORF Transcript_38091/g.79201 Transcript_38091/m.79201 type:complete len:1441 (+) Transcript_38091:125-4447(+)